MRSSHPASARESVERAEVGSAGLDPRTRAQVTDAIDRLKTLPGALLPILHALQDTFGWVPPSVIPLIADGLNITRAEVHGVVSFYPDFRSAPGGRHVLRLCRAEACQALGARALEEHAKRALGIDFHQTTGDRAISFEPVYCLGNCACGPSLLLDGNLHGRVTPGAFDKLIEKARGS
ncbi:MAG TPA: formate dehydrogenase subunit gamma [Rhodanobacteraceae bacterium]|nr:formate dehydrogenase subunit gamma [Rhodanobacteraceae bacterium]